MTTSWIELFEAVLAGDGEIEAEEIAAFADGDADHAYEGTCTE